MAFPDDLCVRLGPLGPLMEADIERLRSNSPDIKPADWAREAFAEKLCVEPPKMSAGSAANAETARRARAARWKKHKRKGDK